MAAMRQRAGTVAAVGPAAPAPVKGRLNAAECRPLLRRIAATLLKMASLTHFAVSLKYSCILIIKYITL